MVNIKKNDIHTEILITFNSVFNLIWTVLIRSLENWRRWLFPQWNSWKRFVCKCIFVYGSIWNKESENINPEYIPIQMRKSHVNLVRKIHLLFGCWFDVRTSHKEESTTTTRIEKKCCFYMIHILATFWLFLISMLQNKLFLSVIVFTASQNESTATILFIVHQVALNHRVTALSARKWRTAHVIAFHTL